MSELNPCWALENRADHHSNVNRKFMEILTTRGEGVRSAADLLVAQRGGGATMSVDIAKGSCLVFGDENEFQGVYGCVNDATVNVAIAAADPTNARWDLIVARVRDDFYSGGTKAWALERVTGTAAPSPADPAVPNNALTLARVVVPPGAASIVNANIADLRSNSPIGIFVVNSARRPGILYGAFSQEPAFKATPFQGLTVIETDTQYAQIYDSNAWVPLGQYARAWAFIAEVNRGSDGPISFTSIPQTFVDLMIVGNIRLSAAATNDYAVLRFNADAGNNYSSTLSGGQNTTGFTVQLASNNRGRFGYSPGSTGGANKFSAIEVLIPNYTAAVHKSWIGRGGNADGTAAQGVVASGFGGWANTAPITQIDLFDDSTVANAFKTLSRATLLGRR